MERLKEASSKLKDAVRWRGDGQQRLPSRESSPVLLRVPDLEGAVLRSVAPRSRGLRRARASEGKEKEEYADADTGVLLATPQQVERLVREEIQRQEARPAAAAPRTRSFGRVLQTGIRSREEMAEYISSEVGRLHRAPSDFMGRQQVEAARSCTQNQVVASVLAAISSAPTITNTPAADEPGPSSSFRLADPAPASFAPAPPSRFGAAPSTALPPWLEESRDVDKETRRLIARERKLQRQRSKERKRKEKEEEEKGEEGQQPPVPSSLAGRIGQTLKKKKSFWGGGEEKKGE
ncbi:hypothetical protein F4775DRAFT_592424 [Biscogniauxia sp. FL1348]|nr:hypothetical protein F4775DRAFT_592424 [Biscogniauxia sp. FL1348]